MSWPLTTPARASGTAVPYSSWRTRPLWHWLVLTTTTPRAHASRTAASSSGSALGKVPVPYVSSTTPSIGAASILDREEFLRDKAALAPALFAGALDNVGGAYFDRLQAKMQPYGKMAVCGMAVGAEVSTTVLPLDLPGRTGGT